MSRSEQAQTFTLRSYAAICCMLALTGACRFVTSPEAGAVASESANATNVEAPDSNPSRTMTSAGAAPDPGLAVDAAWPLDDSASGARPDAPPSAAGAPAAAPSSSAAPQPHAAAPPQPSPAPPSAATPAAPMHDAGTGSTTRATAPNEARCAAELANCLLSHPLGYAECLRANADYNCPESGAHIPTASPVTTEDGKPLSQACQAELADCIVQLPTPENAASCTEKARKCE